MKGDREAGEFVVEFPGGSSREQGDLDNVLCATDGAVVAEVVVEEGGEVHGDGVLEVGR